MNYLNDLAQTGMDGKDCLKVFWPSLEQTMHRIDHGLPRWTRMLQDEQASCCFAVAVYDCLIYSAARRRLCHNSDGHGNASEPCHMNLLSTTINLHENPTFKPPLTSGGILKLNSGRLTIVGEDCEGFAQLAAFWLPGAMDKMTELRLGPRTHTELLDPGRSTGLCVDVCIRDR